MTATLTPEAALATLDLDRPEDVADLLRSHGIVGDPIDVWACPLAVYLQKVTDLPATYVGTTNVTFTATREFRTATSLKLPRAARTFEGMFDQNHEDFLDLRA